MQCPETAEGPAARVVAAGPLALCSGRRSTQSLQKGLRRAWSPLGPLRFCALLPLGFAKQCSVQRLQKGLRRAWSPLGPSLSAVAGAVPRASRRDCGARGRRWAPCGSVRYCHWDLQSNAVSRDCRRACGARGRRWAPRSLQWQAQYPEPPEGTAARVVAAGPPAVLCATAIGICKAMQCPETAEGPAARVVAAGPLALCSGRRSTQSLQKGLRRAWSPLGPLRFCALLPLGFAKQCSVQRLQKGLRRAWSPLGPSLSAVAGAVPRASRRDCGARGRRWAPCGSVRYCHWDLQSNAVSRDCRRACGAAGPLALCSGAVPRASRRDCGARGRRWAPCGSVRYCHWDLQSNAVSRDCRRPAARVVAAGPPAVLCVTAIGICKAMQCPETAEGPAARVVAAGPPAVLCVTAIGICKAMQCPETAEGPAARVVAAGPLALCSGAVSRASRRDCGARGRCWAPCGSVRYCHCDLQSSGCDRLRIAL